MINRFCKHPLWEVNDTLVRVAQGQQPADTVIRHANLVSVTTHEVLEDTDIAIAAGRVAYLGIGACTAEHCIGEKTKVIDASGLYAAPGFLDSHIHIESSMVGVAQYGRAVVPHGTTGVFCDPHEIANVRGLEGVRAMYANAGDSPLKAMVTTPSCVPAVLGVEDTGSSVTAADVADTMGWDDVVGLGEMMNFPGILGCEENALGEVRETLKAGECVTGHYAVPETDRGLNAYIASGVRACHESSRFEDVIARLRMGMYAQLRYGSAWLSLDLYLPQLIAAGVDMRLVLLCTDDNHPNTLLADGGMDRALRRCVELGCDPVTAIQMATINAAQCFGLDQDLGAIAPGKCADLVLLPNLIDFRPTLVLIDGEVVAEGGRALFEPAHHEFPDFMTHTMNLGLDVTAETFAIDAPEGAGGTVTVNTMGIIPGDTITHLWRSEAPVIDGKVCADPKGDLLKVAVFDRHHGADGVHSFGFVKGFGIHGALAQTVAHDAHNLLVMGDNDADMALAVQTLVACGGGEVAVADGQVLALVELPVGGLMSDLSVEEVAAKVEKIERAWVTMGCTMPSPFMTMGIMSLACVPELRLTNRGYVNCVTFQMEPLVVG